MEWLALKRTNAFIFGSVIYFDGLSIQVPFEKKKIPFTVEN